MTIYDLLRILVNGASRANRMQPFEAWEAMDLIEKLERTNAFGTQAAIQHGEDTRNEQR